MSSSYEKVRGSKLNFKGGMGVDKNISKKTKKKKKKKKKIHKDELVDGDENVELVLEGGDNAAASKSTDATEIDKSSGHALNGKKSKKYEKLFPVEMRRHGYVVPSVDSRIVALDERVKKKADRHYK
ncbi:unnamed protein product [Calypogeia fissa]